MAKQRKFNTSYRKTQPEAEVLEQPNIPSRDVMFTKNYDTIKLDAKTDSILTTRDPVKILDRHGEPKLLVEVSNSLMKILSDYRNFIPRIYVSSDTYDLLEKHKVLKAMRNGAFRRAG